MKTHFNCLLHQCSFSHRPQLIHGEIKARGGEWGNNGDGAGRALRRWMGRGCLTAAVYSCYGNHCLNSLTGRKIWHELKVFFFSFIILIVWCILDLQYLKHSRCDFIWWNRPAIGYCLAAYTQCPVGEGNINTAWLILKAEIYVWK